MALTKVQRKRVVRKQQLLRSSFWPNLDESKLWIRTKNHGFTTIPRTMPIIMRIMDDMSKGKRVSSTYLELWCRAFDDCFIQLGKSPDLPCHSGFTGQRAYHTWKERMEILATLEFIDIQPGSSGALSYVLIWNPYHVIKRHREAKHPGVTTEAYNALVARAIEIGAKDMD